MAYTANDFDTEADLVDAFLKFLSGGKHSLGDFAFICEFPFTSGRTDIVGKNKTSMYAFEAKLEKWDRAAQQAYHNTAFVHYSYVLLPKRKIDLALKNRTYFEKRKVGLCFLDNGRMVVALRAPRHRPILPGLHKRAVEMIRHASE